MALIGNADLLMITLNLVTSSMQVCLPSRTHPWNREGATDTPIASAVIPDEE